MRTFVYQYRAAIILGVLTTLLILAGCADRRYITHMNTCLSDMGADVTNCEIWAKEKAHDEREYIRVEWQQRVKDKIIQCRKQSECVLYYNGPTNRRCEIVNNRLSTDRPMCFPRHARENDYQFINRGELERIFGNTEHDHRHERVRQIPPTTTS